MVSFYVCVHPLCNKKMLIDDYGAAIMWRLLAIFFTIAALFSLAVVAWFLIFRENPDMPDETDSIEKHRFLDEQQKEKHNLLSELVQAFRQMSASCRGSRCNNSEQQNFFQRLIYFFCGSTPDPDQDSMRESFEPSPQPSRTDKSKNHLIRNLNKSKNNHTTDSDESSCYSDDRSLVHKDNEKANGLKRLFNFKILNKPKKEAGQNYNLNNNTQGFGSDEACSVINMRKSMSMPLLANRLEINDNLLLEMNKNFEDMLAVKYADARVTINYLDKKNIISIAFYSILNLSNFELNFVHILIDIFYKKSCKKRLVSKIAPVNIRPYEEKLFDQNFFIEFNAKIEINEIKINVFIIGQVAEPNEDHREQETNVVLTSKSSLSDMQILGGAHLVLENLI